VLVEVTCVEVGPSEVGSSWKVSLSEKVVLVPLAVEAGPVEEGSEFLPSRGVLGCAITAGSRSCIATCAIEACAIKECAIEACAIKGCAINAGAVNASWGSCHQGGCGFSK